MFDSKGHVICEDCQRQMRRAAIEVDGEGLVAVVFECTTCSATSEYLPQRHHDDDRPRM